MKHILSLIVCFLLFQVIIAQNPYDSLIIIFDGTHAGSSGGTTCSMLGASKAYFHSGASTSSPTAVWEHVIGNWGMDDGVGQMSSTGIGIPDEWTIKIHVTDYYGLSPLTTVYNIGMVFRNEDGTLEGKDDDCNDLFIRNLDTNFPIVEDAAGNPFSFVTAVWDTTFDTCGSFTLAADVTPANCGNTTGEITINTLGGSGNYNYSWDPPVSTGSFASNLTAGNYSITTQDIVRGCIDSLLVTVNDTCITLPHNPYDTLVITFDGTHSGSFSCSMLGASKAYLHSGAGTSSPTAVWEHVIGNWGQDDGLGQMAPTGISDEWTIKLHIRDYYGLNLNDVVHNIGLVFRNEDGTLEGKDDNCQDLFIRNLTTLNPIVEQANGSPFSFATASWQTTSDTCANFNVSSTITHFECSTLGSIDLLPDGGSGNYSYNWNPPVSPNNFAGNLTPGFYSVTVNDNVLGCSETLELSVLDSCIAPSGVDVTFIVDMSQYPLDVASTIHIAGTFNNWDPVKDPMIPMGNGQYYVTIPDLPPGASMRYKYINGDDWGVGNQDIQQEELILDGPCLVPNGYGDRRLNVPFADDTLGPDCFGYCGPCSEDASIVHVALNMNDYPGTVSTVRIYGDFAPYQVYINLFDTDNDGIWRWSFNTLRNSFAYYYRANGVRELLPPGEPCASTSGLERILVIDEAVEDLPVYCWRTCIDCAPNTCPAPSALWTTHITSTSAVLNWNPVPQATRYVIRGGILGNPNEVTLTRQKTYKQVNKLKPNTTYYWEVQSVCDFQTQPVSAFTGPDIFTTVGITAKQSGSTDLLENNKMMIYPNPSSNTVTIIFSQGEGTLSVYDVMGKLMHHKEIPEGKQSIELSVRDLPVGMYVVEYAGIVQRLQVIKRQ